MAIGIATRVTLIRPCGAEWHIPSVENDRRRPLVAVITGASAGVGRATAHEFARRGASVGLIARSETGLAEAAAEVERMGGRALPVVADVSDAEAVERAAARAESELGSIDVWVNNAMNSVLARVSDMTADEYKRVTEVTYLGTVHGTLAALRRMQPRDRGVIVQVGSALAYRSIPLQSAYCACKHAVEGFTESLRCELLHDGSNVRVTMVQLPALNTPQFDWLRNHLPRRAQPVPPVFQPELAARAIYYAALHPRRQLVVGGPTVLALLVDKLAPGLADRYLAATAFGGQQTDEPEAPNRPDNLYQPVAGLHATHGRFDAQASETSTQFWLNTHRSQVAAGFAGAALSLAAGGLLLTRLRR